MASFTDSDKPNSKSISARKHHDDSLGPGKLVAHETHGLAVKHLGTEADKRDMSILGKKQVLRRNFRFVTMLGFASTVIVSWEILLPVFTFVLINGGTGVLFWGFIAIFIGMLMVYASLAEMASMSPTAGGQYHWVSEHAPPQYQRLLSYLVGWLSAIGWQVFLASVCFMQGGIIQGLIALNVENYSFQPWHATLLTIGASAFAILFNTTLATKLPLIEGFVLGLHIAGLFAIIIPLWTMAPLAPASALITFTNNGGWPTTSLSAMIGLTTPLTALIGYDCSVHMSEEIQDASITLPRAIMWSVIGNALLAFVMAITLVFTAGDIESLLDTSYGQPFIQLFYNVTTNRVATSIMTGIIVVMLCACCVSEVATASRQLWSFARDQGLPASGWLSVVPPGWNLPLRSVFVSFIVTSLLACINLGSTTALNAINSLGGVSVLTSYFVTIGCLVWRRLYGAPLPPRRWSLGRFGLAINLGGLCFVIPLWFFSFWPLAIPVTAISMNWSSTMFGATLIFAMIWYAVHAKKVYTGPVMQMNRDSSPSASGCMTLSNSPDKS